MSETPPNPALNPPRDNIFKHAAIAFICALVGYIFFYGCDAHLRNRQGPWIVEFQSTTNREPLIIIHHARLGIRNVAVLLKGETITNKPVVKDFKSPNELEVPYGRVRFHDLTYLPGTITLDVFGHEIEMLPRTLVINTQETAWRNDALHILYATNKIPGLKDRDRKGRR